MWSDKNQNMDWILRSSLQVFGRKTTGRLRSAEMARGFGTARQRPSEPHTLLEEEKDLFDLEYHRFIGFNQWEDGGALPWVECHRSRSPVTVWLIPPVNISSYERHCGVAVWVFESISFYSDYILGTTGATAIS